MENTGDPKFSCLNCLPSTVDDVADDVADGSATLSAERFGEIFRQGSYAQMIYVIRMSSARSSAARALQRHLLRMDTSA